MGLFKKSPSKSVYFKSENKAASFDAEMNLLDVALKNKIDLDHSCGGSGSCGTCRVLVVQGSEKLEPRGDVEQAMADDRNFADNERLACQVCPVNKIIIEIP